MLALAEWDALWALESAAVGLPAKLFWSTLQYVGISAAPPLFFLFALTYAARGYAPPRRAIATLWIIPAITLELALTNGRHGLIWSHIAPSSPAPTAPLLYTHGAWFWISVAYSYLLMLSGVVLLVRSIIRFPRFYYGQAGVILAGAIVPWIGNILYLAGRNPVFALDPTPLAFTLSSVLMFWGLLRFRLLDLVPVARATLIERMVDGVMVLDIGGRIVDVNPAAQRFLGGSSASLIGKGAHEVFGASLKRDASGDGSPHAPVEMRAPADANVYLEARGIPLHTGAGVRTGDLMVLRDVTDRARGEEELRALNARLQAQLEANTALQARLRDEAIRDPLTGLFNRRYLHETLARAVAHAARAGRPVALAMIDIDHFKDLNDRFGHQTGDRTQQVPQDLLRAGTRAEDVACRYGGEEFVVVLVGTSLAEAYQRAEQWRQEFARLHVDHDGERVRATLSVGVAAYPVDGGGDVLHAADHALYDAKRAGRNRVVAAGATPALSTAGETRTEGLGLKARLGMGETDLEDGLRSYTVPYATPLTGARSVGSGRTRPGIGADQPDL